MGEVTEPGSAATKDDFWRMWAWSVSITAIVCTTVGYLVGWAS